MSDEPLPPMTILDDTGNEILFDDMRVEHICLSHDGKDIAIAIGSTFLLENKVVLRQWPTVSQLIAKLTSMGIECREDA